YTSGIGPNRDPDATYQKQYLLKSTTECNPATKPASYTVRNGCSMPEYWEGDQIAADSNCGNITVNYDVCDPSTLTWKERYERSNCVDTTIHMYQAKKCCSEFPGQAGSGIATADTYIRQQCDSNGDGVCSTIDESSLPWDFSNCDRAVYYWRTTSTPDDPFVFVSGEENCNIPQPGWTFGGDVGYEFECQFRQPEDSLPPCDEEHLGNSYNIGKIVKLSWKDYISGVTPPRFYNNKQDHYLCYYKSLECVKYGANSGSNARPNSNTCRLTEQDRRPWLYE
ncbi:MAG: hypothetical protein IKO35_02170, partial [Elusimicrobiaceae bacterium]|nr:hypothetical protein [Elusimicrobiaceae bacterium]